MRVGSLDGISHSGFTYGASIRSSIVWSVRSGLMGFRFVLCFLVVTPFSGSPTIAQQSPGSVPSASTPGKSLTTLSATPISPNFHEDWTAITLESSALHSEDPVFGERDDVPGTTFIRERYQLAWRPGDPLDLYIIRPRGVPKPPVVLYLYSFPQDTDRFKDDRFCTTLISRGFAAIGFVSAYTGHRTEFRALNKWFVSELQESLVTSVHDVQMILNYLATRGDLDLDRVGMFGQGSGGSIAILASAADARIKAIDVLTPWADWPDWLGKSKVVPEDERAKYLTSEFLASVAPLDPASWLPKVKAKSVRIRDVRRHVTVPDICEERLEAVAPESAEIDQFGDGRAFYEAGNNLFGWIKDQLESDGKSRTIADKSQRVHFYPGKEETIH